MLLGVDATEKSLAKGGVAELSCFPADIIITRNKFSRLVFSFSFSSAVLFDG